MGRVVVAMAVLRRHWKMAVFNGIVLITLLAASLYLVAQRGATAATTEQGAEAVVIDVTEYSRLRELRAATALTALDLASVGCNEQQAEAVLTALRGWYAANAAGLEQAISAERSAERAMDDAVRLINVGPRDEALLGRVPSLRQTLARVRSTREELFAQGAGVAMAAGLSPTQVQGLQVAVANDALPEALRYVAGLSADQKEAARVAAAKRQDLGAIDSSARATYASVIANRGQFMEGVLAAEERVLPVPPELRERATETAVGQSEGGNP